MVRASTPAVQHLGLHGGDAVAPLRREPHLRPSVGDGRVSTAATPWPHCGSMIVQVTVLPGTCFHSSDAVVPLRLHDRPGDRVAWHVSTAVTPWPIAAKLFCAVRDAVLVSTAVTPWPIAARPSGPGSTQPSGLPGGDAVAHCGETDSQKKQEPPRQVSPAVTPWPQSGQQDLVRWSIRKGRTSTAITS